MGYTKVIQYGDIVEIREYEKNIRNNKRGYISPTAKKRSKNIQRELRAKGLYKRTDRSIKNSRDSFFRLCHHNNCLADTIHFLTLTFPSDYVVTYKEASRHVARFLERIKKNLPQVPFTYISVPELTKKGQYHFHLLVYNLPPETAKLERKTRNFQRQFQRGYVDIRLATYRSSGIAGYMAKYMGKALTDIKNEITRGYTCSRNIDKATSHGSNSLSGYLEEVIPNGEVVYISEYDVPYLGKCRVKKIKKI